jgi:TPR repeat protein
MSIWKKLFGGSKKPQPTAEELAIEAAQARRLQELKVKAEAGDAQVQCALGSTYYKSADTPCTPEDFAEAVKWFRKAAAQGHSGARNQLNYLERKGMI